MRRTLRTMRCADRLGSLSRASGGGTGRGLRRSFRRLQGRRGGAAGDADAQAPVGEGQRAA